MENIGEKILLIVFVLIVIGIIGFAWYFMFYESSDYYSKIDNSRIAQITEKNGMKYEYTLDCYNEKGKIKEIKFKTNRELKDGAFIKLNVMITCGVTDWEEVMYDELPSDVKIKYNI